MIVRASPLPPDPKREDLDPGACCRLLGFAVANWPFGRGLRRPPGGPRRSQEAAEVPQNHVIRVVLG